MEMTRVKSSSLLCFVGLSFLLLARCDCLKLHSVSHQAGQEYREVPISMVKLLPRKLQVTDTVRENAEKASRSESYTPDKKILQDELEWKKASTAAAKAHLGRGQTWQQRIDNGGDSSEFFTMDYSRVRRRRPIHNKSLPVGP